ncbi:MAG: DUF5984 family protein [Myroides sp.]|nr:DUF5984 family protein [Myroides sp.]
MYEYSKEAIYFLGTNTASYVDYPIIRFIEDFTALFDKIRESVPSHLYTLTNNLKNFDTNTKKWLDLYDTEDDSNDIDNDFYFNEYLNLTSWISQRCLDSGHLIGGPYLYFFRYVDKIRIIWQTDYNLDNGIPLWSAKDGSLEMDYNDFVHRITDFGLSFFSEMEKQTNLSFPENWKNVTIDKERVAFEQIERKEKFFTDLQLLNQESSNKTNWLEIQHLLNRMTNEI